MSTLKAAEKHLLELRKIHSMLHAAMDSLIKDLNANESARILILLDDRLTSLINTAEIESETRSTVSRDAELPRSAPAPVTKMSDREPPSVSPTLVGAGEPRKPLGPTPAPLHPAAEPLPRPVDASDLVASAPKAIEVAPSLPLILTAESAPPDEGDIPATPIMAVPPAAERSPTDSHLARPAFRAPEDPVASAARANVEVSAEPNDTALPKPLIASPPPQRIAEGSQPKVDVGSPSVPAAVEAVAAAIASPPVGMVVPTPTGSATAGPQDEAVYAGEEAEDDSEWIEEDLEDGDDLDVEPEPEPESHLEERKGGFAGRFLSKLRLPGLGRRRAEAELAPAFEEGIEEESVGVDLSAEERNEGAPVSAALADNLRRLHGVAEHIAAGQLLAEAEERTGNRIELRSVPTGLDLVVKGLPTALGTVRLSEDGHVLYQPRFGLDLPDREPNRADLELWTKAMGDLVVRVLEDIAARRKNRTAAPDGDGHPS